MAKSMHFVLTRFYQNVGEVVHDRYKSGSSFHVALFIQPLAQLKQSVVDSQQLLEGVVVDHHGWNSVKRPHL